MTPAIYLAIYGIAVVAVSVLGGWVPIYIRLNHRRLQIMSSLVAGFMLGVALLILLPHALTVVSIGAAMGFLILGLLVMFFLERFFAYHHHDVPQGLALEPGHDHRLHDARHAHHPPHDPHDPQSPDERKAVHRAMVRDHVHKLSWTGAGTGLVLHSLIDGIALAAAVYADSIGDGSFWPGFVVFLVVVFHRPLDAMTLLALATGPGWTETRRHLVNAAFALAVPLGSILFLLGVGGDMEHSQVAGSAMAFAAGVFLCVSLSDLLPELQFHSHDRLPLSAALLIGLGLAAAVYWFESRSHDHGHTHPIHAAPDAPPDASPNAAAADRDADHHAEPDPLHAH